MMADPNHPISNILDASLETLLRSLVAYIGSIAFVLTGNIVRITSIVLHFVLTSIAFKSDDEVLVKACIMKGYTKKMSIEVVDQWIFKTGIVTLVFIAYELIVVILAMDCFTKTMNYKSHVIVGSISVLTHTLGCVLVMINHYMVWCEPTFWASFMFFSFLLGLFQTIIVLSQTSGPHNRFLRHYWLG